MNIAVEMGNIQWKSDSQWQKMKLGVPQWQKFEYWYPIEMDTMEISWFKAVQGVVPLSNPVTHPEGFSYRYTSMGVQILAPKKWNIHLFTLLFYTAGYVSFF